MAVADPHSLTRRLGNSGSWRKGERLALSSGHIGEHSTDPPRFCGRRCQGQRLLPPSSARWLKPVRVSREEEGASAGGDWPVGPVSQVPGPSAYSPSDPGAPRVRSSVARGIKGEVGRVVCFGHWAKICFPGPTELRTLSFIPISIFPISKFKLQFKFKLCGTLYTG